MLQDAEEVEVVTCRAVLAEAQRLLQDRFRASDIQLATAQAFFQHINMVRDGTTPMPVGFPDPDDWPILAAALCERADLFVTGDKALLELGEVEGVAVVSPRSAFISLRGLE